MLIIQLLRFVLLLIFWHANFIPLYHLLIDVFKEKSNVLGNFALTFSFFLKYFLGFLIQRKTGHCDFRLYFVSELHLSKSWVALLSLCKFSMTKMNVKKTDRAIFFVITELVYNTRKIYINLVMFFTWDNSIVNLMWRKNQSINI